VRQIRNFDHLLLAKQLYQDALDSSDRGDRSLLTRSLIILDLSIELALKNADLERFLESAARMLSAALRDGFGLDFRNLRRWDFVENEDLRTLLNECEEYLRSGNPVVCMIGCKWTRDIVIEAIHEHADRFREGHAPHLNWRTRDLEEGMGELGDFLRSQSEYVNKRIRRLEDEIVLIGFGLSTTDTRQFLNARGVTYEVMMADGHMQIQIAGDAAREESEHEATFMLNYLSRLLRALGESSTNILASVSVQVPLSGQGIASYDWFKESA
jgi:DNA-binding Lrp family transcriptional regulator